MQHNSISAPYYCCTITSELPLKIKVYGHFKKKACTIVFDCLSNNVCELFKKYFEEMDHKHTTRNNHISVKMQKIDFETAQNRFHFLGC